MAGRILTALGIAAAAILSVGGTAVAGERGALHIVDGRPAVGPQIGEPAVDTGFMFELGAWSLGPVATLGRADDVRFGDTGIWVNRPSDGLVGSLGVRGAAKVDSRFGAIYSRLSLSFEHAFRTSAYQTVTGLSGGGRNGYYGNRTGVDVMTLDAAFALRLAKDVTGFIDYGAEIDPGSGADHQALLRIKFDF